MREQLIAADPVETFDNARFDGHGIPPSDQALQREMAELAYRNRQTAPLLQLPRSDDGQGIPPEDTASLLDRYRQHWNAILDRADVHSLGTISAMEMQLSETNAVVEETGYILADEVGEATAFTFEPQLVELTIESHDLSAFPITIRFHPGDATTIYAHDVPCHLAERMGGIFQGLTSRALEIVSGGSQPLYRRAATVAINGARRMRI